MTRSTVASVRWVTATEDANSILASLTSAGEKPYRTHFPADDFTARSTCRRLPLVHRSFSTAPTLTRLNGSERIVTAKFITGQCQSQRPFRKGKQPELPSLRL